VECRARAAMSTPEARGTPRRALRTDAGLQMAHRESRSYWDRFTSSARLAVYMAQEDAVERNEHYVGPEHLLCAILQLNESVGARVLDRLGVSRLTLHADLELRRVRGSRPARGDAELSRESMRAFSLAYDEQGRCRHGGFTTGHLLLGLIRAKDSLPARLLNEHGVTLEPARLAVVEIEEEMSSTGTPPGTAEAPAEGQADPAAN
jgi:ATP-dependent Clp protease ATP-binding subunit ClpA